eukprot:scaffold388085_cov53-Prasinocladus_malaysianus.AAC.1
MPSCARGRNSHAWLWLRLLATAASNDSRGGPVAGRRQSRDLRVLGRSDNDKIYRPPSNRDAGVEPTTFAIE